MPYALCPMPYAGLARDYGGSGSGISDTVNSFLSMVAIQVLVLIGMVVLIYLGKSGSMNPESVEAIFRHLGLTFVALSPVGIISAFLSLGLKFALSFNLFTANHMRLLQKRRLLKFFIWEEILRSNFAEASNVRLE